MMRVVILSTRISGNDGVSLECNNWRKVFAAKGDKVTLVAGELDARGILIPELHFQHPKIATIHDDIVYNAKSYKEVYPAIEKMSSRIQSSLEEVLDFSNVDLLVLANVLSLPMNIPLAVAITDLIKKYQIKTVARHHDFWWERERFEKLDQDWRPFLEKYFPPDIPCIKHVVINSISQRKLLERTGLRSEIIWDSFDENLLKMKNDGFLKHFKDDLKIKKTDIVFLNATRLIKRKRIELGIKLISKLGNKNILYLLSGRQGDENGNYKKELKELAKELRVRLRFIGSKVDSKRKLILVRKNGSVEKRRIYSLWDCYRMADFVTYMTGIEGFGNQFVEAVFFKKPLIMTPYPVYEKDIKPLGFRPIEVSGGITNKDVTKVTKYLDDPRLYNKDALKNYQLAQKYLSYGWVSKSIGRLIS